METKRGAIGPGLDGTPFQHPYLGVGIMLLVPVQKFLLSASRGLDFTYGGLLEHHQRVAYLSLALGQAAGLSRDQLNTPV